MYSLLTFSVVFLVFLFIYFSSNLWYFLFLLTVDLFRSSFFSFLRCEVRLFVIFFLILVLITINFPLRTAFIGSYKFWYIMFSFHLSQGMFPIDFFFNPNGCSGACGLISIYLWIFQFSSFSWFLVLCYCDWTRGMIWFQSSFKTLLKLVLCPNLWSILENVLWAHEKNVYSVSARRNALCIVVWSVWCKA